MKLLILGGTVFLGRHLVEQALAAGHEVTLFNRGLSDPELFSDQVEKIVGDRNQDLNLIGNRHFDACIDPSGYLPGHVQRSASYLKDQVDRYVFVSSISAYPGYDRPGIDETCETALLPEGVDQDVYDVTHYGAFKVLCEQAAEAAMPGRVLQIRSGLIVGPYDPTNRFTYWPTRIARGGDVLCPVSPEFPVQIIHGADLARFILHALATDQMGVFNVTSEQGRYTFADVWQSTLEVTGTAANPIYASSEFLLKQKVGPYMEFPLWLPDSHINMSLASTKKAAAAGMELIPLSEVVGSTLDWFQKQPEQDWPGGLAPDRERQLLQDLLP